MAVPKKKISKSKGGMRYYIWQKKTLKKVLIALSYKNLLVKDDSLYPVNNEKS
uniref:Ribosomal protein L32 n=1 Tax=Trachelomonas grandis TaxID=215769 RepID=A0A385ULS4_9EUGL|nr:ribosomal protein L32 [Trachelomonas grandis]